jgi:guanosine-3',5'-bis(diphosphate) 3'-pyrophosphohydrolase
VALGRKIYDEIVQRLPAQLRPDAQAQALKRLKLADETALMEAIARRTITDAQVMEALMPGSGSAESARQVPPQTSAISIKGLTPGVAYDLADCCRPVPGDRIVGLRRPNESIEVHRIDCPCLAEVEDVDWVDLAWGDKVEGGTARIAVEVKNEPGALGVVSTIIGAQRANIINLRLDARDTTFHTNTIDVEVHDAHHLMRVLAALRAADAVSRAERTAISA